MDLNREIKLSDLFRRRAKEPAEDAEKTPRPERPKEQRRALFSRGEKQPGEPKGKRGRRGKGVAAEPKGAPAPPQIPLMRAVNLLPRDEASEKRGRIGVPEIAVALLGVLLFGGLAGGYLLTSAGVSAKRAELDDLRAELAELQVATQAPDPGGATLAAESLARATALDTALSTRIAWDRILRELALVVPESVWLTEIGAASENASGTAEAVPPTGSDGQALPNSLNLAGYGLTQEDVALLLARLGTVPEFASIQLQASSRTQGEDGSPRYQFSILVGVDPAGVPSS